MVLLITVTVGQSCISKSRDVIPIHNGKTASMFRKSLGSYQLMVLFEVRSTGWKLKLWVELTDTKVEEKKHTHFWRDNDGQLVCHYGLCQGLWKSDMCFAWPLLQQSRKRVSVEYGYQPKDVSGTVSHFPSMELWEENLTYDIQNVRIPVPWSSASCFFSETWYPPSWIWFVLQFFGR